MPAVARKFRDTAAVLMQSSGNKGLRKSFRGLHICPNIVNVTVFKLLWWALKNACFMQYMRDNCLMVYLMISLNSNQTCVYVNNFLLVITDQFLSCLVSHILSLSASQFSHPCDATAVSIFYAFIGTRFPY